MNASSRAEANSNRLSFNGFCGQVRIVDAENRAGQDGGDFGRAVFRGELFWVLDYVREGQRVLPQNGESRSDNHCRWCHGIRPSRNCG